MGIYAHEKDKHCIGLQSGAGARLIAVFDEWVKDKQRVKEVPTGPANPAVLTTRDGSVSGVAIAWGKSRE